MRAPPGRSPRCSTLWRPLICCSFPILPQGSAYPIALVVATHPHQDHIAGLGQLSDQFGTWTAEFWEPGFFHTASSYHRMMTAVEAHPHVVYTQPTSGLQRWFGTVGLTVLSTSIQLRNRFDTYGVEINDSSISVRFEYPAARVVQAPNGQSNYQPNLPSGASRSRCRCPDGVTP